MAVHSPRDGYLTKPGKANANAILEEFLHKPRHVTPRHLTPRLTLGTLLSICVEQIRFIVKACLARKQRVVLGPLISETGQISPASLCGRPLN